MINLTRGVLDGWFGEEVVVALRGKPEASLEDLRASLAQPFMAMALDRCISELVESRASDLALKAGDRAPSFRLFDWTGKAHSLQSLLAKGPMVLTFFRGSWCPSSEAQLRALEEARAEIEQRGGTTIAISQQARQDERFSPAASELGFPLLMDQGGTVAARFGLRWTLPDYLRSAYRDVGVDLEALHGDASWTLPMSSIYVISKTGMIVYSEVSADPSKRQDPRDILPILSYLSRTRFN